MAEYIDKSKIPWVKTDNPKGKYWDRIVCESTIKNMEPEDVIERSKIDTAIKEIEGEYSTCNQDWIDGLNRALEILKRNIGE